MTTFLDDAVGAWLQLPGSATAELVASAGFDLVCIDQQHGLIGDDALLPMLQAVAATGLPALVRPAVNAPDAIGRALDRGADGVVIPLVDSAADAAAAAAACHHPPRGSRSYGPVRQGWRAQRAAPLCIVMIETTGGVAALPEILAVEGVDGIFVGPSDLALAHGMPLAAQDGDPDYDAIIRAIVGPTRERGLPIGIYTASAAHARRFRGLGFTFTAGPSEATLLHAAVAQHVTDARRTER